MLGSHRGGGGGRQVSWFDGKMKAYGTDRFCTGCGKLIKGLATTMIGKCNHCGESVPLRFGPGEEDFDSTGWGRCSNCKSFIYRDHVHCQSCSLINLEGKNKRERLQKKAMLQRQAVLKAENEAKDAKIARLEAMNEELTNIVTQQERSANLSAGGNEGTTRGIQIRETVARGNSELDAFQDDGLDDVLSQIDTEESSENGASAGNKRVETIGADVGKE